MLFFVGLVSCYTPLKVYVNYETAYKYILMAEKLKKLMQLSLC